ncbi:MAG: VOC family protein [bacterium]|nr:VOC family protein [bacterium]
MSRVVHFEIPSDDPKRLKEFFTNTFGWSFEEYGDENYQFASTGEKSGLGIDGAIMKRNHPQQPVVNTIGVASVDDAVAKIEANGGTVVMPKQQVGDMGYVAYFKDPEGNIHGVWEAMQTNAATDNN